MSNNFDETMSMHIGDIGGEATNTNEFGKLRYTDKQDDNSEAMRDFTAATERIRKSNILKEEYEYSENQFIRDGWIPIERSDMGIRSTFYPSDWVFSVKPANVVAIRNWASIDEENIAAVNNVMNEIIRTCVSISSEVGKISWEKINSWDRFWFIMKVHEYTFKSGEHKIEFDDECNECGETLTFTLSSANLHYSFPDDNVIDNCWDSEKGAWVINPQNYGLTNKPITLYTPTLGKDNAIVQWLYAQNQQGKKIDEVFIKFLPFMLERASKDSNVLDKQIKDCQRTFQNWDTDMFLFMDEVIRNITVNPSEKLEQKCNNCGGEVCSNVRFPNGIKYLFVVQNRHTKFGSR